MVQEVQVGMAVYVLVPNEGQRLGKVGEIDLSHIGFPFKVMLNEPKENGNLLDDYEWSSEVEVCKPTVLETDITEPTATPVHTTVHIAKPLETVADKLLEATVEPMLLVADKQEQPRVTVVPVALVVEDLRSEALLAVLKSI